jgi:hypothetical protein
MRFQAAAPRSVPQFSRGVVSLPPLPIDGQIELHRQSGRREIHPVDVGADRVPAGADVDG